MPGLKIEDANAITTLDGSEKIPASKTSQPKHFTLNTLWTWIKGKMFATVGTLEFTIDAENCSTPVLNDDEQIIGYKTYQNDNLKLKESLTLIALESQLIYSTERTYNSTAGTITLGDGLMFIPETRMLTQFKKS